MSNRNYHYNTERLGAVKARQMVWTFQAETAGLSDDDLVDTVTQVTPFGRFLLVVKPAA